MTPWSAGLALAPVAADNTPRFTSASPQWPKLAMGLWAAFRERRRPPAVNGVATADHRRAAETSRPARAPLGQGHRVTRPAPAARARSSSTATAESDSPLPRYIRR